MQLWDKQLYYNCTISTEILPVLILKSSTQILLTALLSHHHLALFEVLLAILTLPTKLKYFIIRKKKSLDKALSFKKKIIQLICCYSLNYLAILTNESQSMTK